MYKASNLGRIFNVQKGKLKKLSKDKDGYLVCSLFKKQYKVHRLIAKTFIKNFKNKPFVNHKDGNKGNNCYTNLEWVTAKENTEHARKNNLINDEKMIIQYSLDNKFIKVWKSQHEASRELNIHQGDISKCCNNKLKTAGKFIWKFKKEGD